LLVMGALSVLAAASCDDPNHGRDHGIDCSPYGGRCRTVCDYWCDDWGCYPSCWNQCFGSECAGAGMVVPPSTSEAPVNDGGTATPVADGGRAGGDGSGVLCSACAVNDDCASGALCVLRGGGAGAPADASATDGGAPPASATGFCSHACSGASDCPPGFTCTQLGSAKQCLPNAGTCP
jgi:hypothetical protein